MRTAVLPFGSMVRLSTKHASRVQVKLLQLTNVMMQSCAASWLGAEEES